MPILFLWARGSFLNEGREPINTRNFGIVVKQGPLPGPVPRPLHSQNWVEGLLGGSGGFQGSSPEGAPDFLEVASV